MAHRIATVVEYKHYFFCFNDLKNFTKTERKTPVLKTNFPV